MVDGQCSFQETMQHFDQWMQEQGLLSNKIAFVTSGNWDLQVLFPRQCQNENFPVPKYFTSWINIKQVFMALIENICKF